ncbi:MAG: hypothetical protein V4655_06490, partial [Bdellovibrionota bacterium]
MKSLIFFVLSRLKGVRSLFILSKNRLMDLSNSKGRFDMITKEANVVWRGEGKTGKGEITT